LGSADYVFYGLFRTNKSPLPDDLLECAERDQAVCDQLRRAALATLG